MNFYQIILGYGTWPPYSGPMYNRAGNGVRNPVNNMEIQAASSPNIIPEDQKILLALEIQLFKWCSMIVSHQSNHQDN